MAHNNTEGGWNRYADMLWQFVSPKTPDGKRKSTILLYSFGLSLVFTAIYVGCYALFVPIIDNAFNPALGDYALLAVEMLIPAIIGGFVCNIFFLIGEDKRLVPAAYLWVIGYAVAFLAVMMIAAGSAQERGFMLYLFSLYCPVPLALGVAIAGFLFWRHRKYHKPVKELPAWRKK